MILAQIKRTFHSNENTSAPPALTAKSCGGTSSSQELVVKSTSNALMCTHAAACAETQLSSSHEKMRCESVCCFAKSSHDAIVGTF